MITIADFFMGRREKYRFSLSPAIEANAARTVLLVNALLERAAADGVSLTKTSPNTGTLISSGWRPPAVNAATKGAATTSKHMTGQAADLYDPDGALDSWLMTDPGQKALTEIGLWLEHPDSTVGWCHVQTQPPGSGRRVFKP